MEEYNQFITLFAELTRGLIEGIILKNDYITILYFILSVIGIYTTVTFIMDIPDRLDRWKTKRRRLKEKKRRAQEQA